MANEKFKDKIVKVFGMDDENYEDDYRDAYEDELDGVEDEYVEETEPVRKSSPRKVAPLNWCGIREGELLALTKDDFDLEKKTLTISREIGRASCRERV